MSQLSLAVPSKGRLEEQVSALFAAAKMPLQRLDARGYSGKCTAKGMDIDVLYLSAGEIAARIVAGDVHLGITGEDLMREEVQDMDSAATICTPLGFGAADVVLAVPEAWADVRYMSDLAEVASQFREYHARPLRIATKYTRLAGDFLARHGVYDVVLVASSGATEGAIASGVAETIVDITSSGATLAANELRILGDGVILKSQANLIKSVKAKWDDAARYGCERFLAQLGEAL